MTWFRVDDHLSDHRKVRKAGTSAMGLWVLSGSWSAAHLTDGWVPREVALRYGTERQAERLEASGLWVAGDVDDEPGWFFHQWTDHQPTREQVQLRRKNAAERQASWRQKKQETAGSDDPSRVDKDVSNGVSHAAPDPTRPVPKEREQKKTPSSSPAQQRGQRIPADFTVSPAMVDWAREKTPLVGRTETENFIDHWTAASGRNATKRDWVAAWRTWMRNAQTTAERHQPRRQANGTNGLQNSTDAHFAALLAATNGNSNGPQLRALPGGA
jgi:hypothetical protein